MANAKKATAKTEAATVVKMKEHVQVHYEEGDPELKLGRAQNFSEGGEFTVPNRLLKRMPETAYDVLDDKAKVEVPQIVIRRPPKKQLKRTTRTIDQAATDKT